MYWALAVCLLPVASAGAYEFLTHLPLALWSLEISLLVTPATFLAIATCLFCVFLLYRRIQVIGQLSKLLWIGVLGTIAWVIFSGVTHFNAARAFDFPPHAFSLNSGFFFGLGSAMLVAAYDYWGYYNVCFLGDEVQEPARTIPRALIYSIVVVAVLYIVMNISILGVIPWRELMPPPSRTLASMSSP